MALSALAALVCGCGAASGPMSPGTTYTVDQSNFAAFSFSFTPRGLYCLDPGAIHSMTISHEAQRRFVVRYSRVSARYCAGGTLVEESGAPRVLTDDEIDMVLRVFRHVELETALPSCDWSPVIDVEAHWDRARYDRDCQVDHLSENSMTNLYGLTILLELPPMEPPNNALHAPVAGVGRR